MKSGLLLWVFCIILSILCFYGMHQNRELKKQIQNLNTNDKWIKTEEPLGEIEVAHFMSRIQQYHMKLYFAGIENNRDLMTFYLHELEEEMETIAKARITDGEINISQNMQQIGLTEINNFNSKMASPSFNFEQSFEQLTFSCNTCHQSSGFPFIQIIIPSENPIQNQQFKKN